MDANCEGTRKRGAARGWVVFDFVRFCADWVGTPTSLCEPGSRLFQWVVDGSLAVFSTGRGVVRAMLLAQAFRWAWLMVGCIARGTVGGGASAGWFSGEMPRAEVSACSPLQSPHPTRGSLLWDSFPRGHSRVNLLRPSGAVRVPLASRPDVGWPGGTPSAFGTSPCKGEEMGMRAGFNRGSGVSHRSPCK